jgi:nucleotide-binding universal stress UspA family protein
MFGTVVVGVDGRSGGDDAVALTRSLAGPGDRIIALHAHPDGTPVGELVERDALALLDRADLDDGWERRAVADLSPARALQRAAESEGAGLVVIGPSHRSPAGRAVAGDVARSVLHGAPCPVAVASAGTAEHARLIRSIGVGVDDRPASRAALALAVALATERQATLRLLRAVSPPTAFAPAYAYTYDWTTMLEQDSRAARSDLEELAAGLDVPAVVDVEIGSADERLEALSRGVDLLVVGSRGWGAFRRVVLGSTSDHVVHHASCPVVVVPAPPEAGDAA